MGGIWSNSEIEQKRVYGWKRSKHLCSQPFHKFEISKNLAHIKVVDLRDQCPPVYDQGQLGSCTANAIGFAHQFDQMKQGEKNPYTPSRLFIYYNERDMEGNIDQDVGASIKDGIASVNQLGVCPETMWPYDIQKFKDKPTKDCYDIALKNVSISSKRLDGTNLEQLKQCLVDGFPFVFGFEVFESFESKEVATTGVMPMPKDGERVLGGHAVAAVAYSSDRNAFLIRNSWGDKWGDKGYFWMPVEFITNAKYTDDFWAIEKLKE
jgi:C1A family cysteine protease